tara:strand:+ start:115 stop:639 length:525 start_codon:yes stop_codon:yes gene_type:complete
MKNLITLLLISFTLNSFCQTINYSDLDTNKRPRGKFITYVSKSGDVYSVGDKIIIGAPSSSNGRFLYLTSVDIAGTQTYANEGSSNTNAEIKKIRVSGSKRSGWKVTFQLKATIVSNYFIFAEDGFSSGELISKGFTSEQALEKLKKAKDKLDLELITQEEYNKIKAKLIKYIK